MQPVVQDWCKRGDVSMSLLPITSMIYDSVQHFCIVSYNTFLETPERGGTKEVRAAAFLTGCYERQSSNTSG